jgi:hypothetical protein
MSQTWTDGKILTAWERTLVRAIAEAMFHDPTQPPIPTERLDWLEGDVDDYLSRISGLSRLGLRVALRLFAVSPVLQGEGLILLQSLPVEARIGCLQRLEDSPLMPISMVFFLVKVVLAATYFEHPDALATIGFDGMALRGPRADNPLTLS